MLITAEKAADWLLSGIELHSTLFHVGQYCGSYRASTAGHHRASFHIVLEGECWLHIPSKNGHPPSSTRLGKGDAAIFLRDVIHCLSPDSHAPSTEHFSVRAGSMTPLQGDDKGVILSQAGSVALACGFFEFRSDLGESLQSLLPEHIVARHSDARLAGARVVFELIRAEAIRSGDAPSPVINRLTDALFLYALRAAASSDDCSPGLWTVMCRTEFSPLVNAIIENPGAGWSTNSMAAFCHMSRARFCKHFTDLCGQPPAQFLALLRMKVAAEMLRQGASTMHAAEYVGYQSESAFSQAFKRVTGLPPGACRRARINSISRTSAAAGAPMH
jgi:AraC-like DNA-binding protein